MTRCSRSPCRLTNRLVRIPKEFPADHPAADLVPCRRWGAVATLPAEAALDTDFAGLVVERFRALAPLVGFRNTAMLEEPAAEPRVRAPTIR